MVQVGGSIEERVRGLDLHQQSHWSGRHPQVRKQDITFLLTT
jgi:hypothetical protein